ncbi:hypothetical protein FOXG_02977 [Fusarium oxysporum f. sp. lycopersici 4287]|uniref:Uncharacterized protein n=2 Tax=Fusarium oxysporum TaxID=5507 RepID=A0A0J9UKL1_FUSO4|nr:hypothetical protein FOXG_02977 [Fusarium oxysporum f. sp. lycopersici 4287]KNA98685.1 hypothetical protein FOXG_02977 [Fusarium oxysporum f. sp. lycopersici 4287]
MPSHWSARRLVENVLEVIPTAIVTNSLQRTCPMKWRCRWGRMRDPENREPRGLLQDPSHAPAAAAAAATVAVRGLQPKPESDPRLRTRPSGCGWTLEKHSHIPRG